MRARLLSLALVLSLFALPAGAEGLGARIRGFVNRWMGTPYLWGGAGRGGIDCSGFVREMFRDVFRVELPRTTKQQIELGIDLPINPRNLEAGLQIGDLFLFVDSLGIPNHIVVYMGGGQITHSVSGRGVVVDPMRYLYGRRLIARRLLLPSSGGGGGFGPIPAAGPIVAVEVPCPPDTAVKSSELRALRQRAIGEADYAALGARGLCDARALAQALDREPGGVARANAGALRGYALWLEDLDQLKDSLAPRR